MNGQTWLVARCQPTTFFTLKPANATSSGGKTLVAPTPFALKMALLDAAIRTGGLAAGRELFPALRDLSIAIRLPPGLVVNNTFIKILRPHKGSKAKDTTGTGLAGPMGNTIAYREFVAYDGTLELAFTPISEPLTAEQLAQLLLQIHYLGKRGGFIQWLDVPAVEPEAAVADYTRLTEAAASFDSRGLMQVLDDCGPAMTFDHANIYENKRISLGKHRILRHVVLPYALKKSSQSFSYYERIEDG